MAINGNDLAKRIAATEGKRQQVSIAQIKEVIRCLQEELVTYRASEVMAWVEKADR